MYWIDLGTHEKYRQAHQDILEGKLTNTKYFKKFYVNNVAIGVGTKLSKKTELYGPVVIGENCKIENKVTLNEFTVIGNRCHIAENVYLERCIIWDDVIIESGARLTGCIIGKNSHIGSHSSISDGVVLGDNNRIQPYSYL